MAQKFNFQPLLVLDGKMPKEFKVIHSDLSSVKSTIKVIAKYKFGQKASFYEFSFYLFNLPTHSGSDIWLSSFSKKHVEAKDFNSSSVSPVHANSRI